MMSQPMTDVMYIHHEVKLLANEVRAEGTEVHTKVARMGGSRYTVIFRANENIPLV
jgi:hypothetical protein